MNDPANEVIACRAMRLRPRPLLQFLKWLGFAMAAPSLLFGALIPSAAVLGFAALLGAGPIWLAIRARRRAGGEVVFADGGLRFQIAWIHRFIPSADVVGGHVAGGRAATQPAAAVLRLKTGAEIVLEPRVGGPANETAERILGHVGMAAGQRAIQAPLRGELGAFTKGLLTMFFSALIGTGVLGARLGPWGVLAGFVLASLATIFVVSRFGAPRVVVGSDGVRVEGGFRRVFVPFSQVSGVRLVGHWGNPPYADVAPHTAVEVLRHGQPPLRLPTIAQTTDQVNALVKRIQDGMKAYAPAADDKLLGALERSGRPVARWREDLRKVALAGGGFRDQALGREDFERVLADASASPDRRVGAALALRALDEEAAPRIRLAAASAANEGVRVALEAAGAEEIDEEALGESLAKASAR